MTNEQLRILLEAWHRLFCGKLEELNRALAVIAELEQHIDWAWVGEEPVSVTELMFAPFNRHETDKWRMVPNGEVVVLDGMREFQDMLADAVAELPAEGD